MKLRLSSIFIIGGSVFGLGLLWIYQYMQYGYIMLKEGTRIFGLQAIICMSSAAIIGLMLIMSELRRQIKEHK